MCEGRLVTAKVMQMWHEICPDKYRVKTISGPGPLGARLELTIWASKSIITIEIMVVKRNFSSTFEGVDFILADPKFFDKIKEKMAKWVDDITLGMAGGVDYNG